MVDTVQAPALKGEYVLRWRWDVEQVSFQWKNSDFLLRNPDFLLKNVDFLIKQNPQVWTHCADVTVV